MRNKAKRTRRRRPATASASTNLRRHAAARVLSPGVWAVVEVEFERVVISGFASMAAAWAWIDRHPYDGRKLIDTHHRIRMAFNREWFDSWVA